jgi:hypothetical protein
MNATFKRAIPGPVRQATKLRKALVGTLFALVLVVPKTLRLQRNERFRMIFRVALGIVGAAFVVLPLGLWNSYLFAVLGLAMFILAILLPAAKPKMSADDKARQLQALVVINGGEYRVGETSLVPVRLFVGREHIWALDSRWQPLLVIPLNEVASAQAEETGGGWHLRIRWATNSAEFAYHGFFSEHLARVAESTLATVIRSSLPVLSQSRAAGA